MENLLERDKIKRVLFSRKESSRVALKYICSNKQLPLKVRWVAGVLPRRSTECSKQVERQYGTAKIGGPS